MFFWTLKITFSFLIWFLLNSGVIRDTMQSEYSGGRGGSGEHTPTFGAAGAGVEQMQQVCMFPGL